MITKRNIIIVAVVLSITGCLYAQNTKQQKASNRPINMNTTNICELPDDINVLRQYIKNRYGDELSIDDVKDLEKKLDFTLSKDKTSKDWLGKDKETEIRYIWLGKECVAKDGVTYRLYMFTVFSDNNEPIIHTLGLVYPKEALINKKRPFNRNAFSLIHLGYAREILGKHATGVMNRIQFDKYIRDTGAVTYDRFVTLKKKGIERFAKLPHTNIGRLKLTKVKDDNQLKNQNKIKYFYPIPFGALFRTSPMLLLDVVQEVTVEYDTNNIVKKITVIQ